MSLLPATVADENLSVTAAPAECPMKIPSAWHSATHGTDQAELTIDIQMRGLGRDLVDYLAACLRQIAYVEVALTTEKRSAPG